MGQMSAGSVHELDLVHGPDPPCIEWHTWGQAQCPSSRPGPMLDLSHQLSPGSVLMPDWICCPSSMCTRSSPLMGPYYLAHGTWKPGVRGVVSISLMPNFWTVGESHRPNYTTFMGSIWTTGQGLSIPAIDQSSWHTIKQYSIYT